jgi:dUTP pyrophosphatase
MKIPVKIQFVSNEAKELYNGELKYETEGSSGFDLRACEFSYYTDEILQKDYRQFNDSKQGGGIYGLKPDTYYVSSPFDGTLLTGVKSLTGFPIYSRGIMTLSDDINQMYENDIKYRIEYNLKYVLDNRLQSGATVLIKTGIKTNLQSNSYEIQVRTRSGLASKNGIIVLNSPGTVDSDYQKEICVILHNTSNTAFEIEKGMRIAQAVICPVIKANFEYVESIEDGSRGGFGSTGIK